MALLLQNDATERPTVATILSLPFLKKHLAVPGTPRTGSGGGWLGKVEEAERGIPGRGKEALVVSPSKGQVAKSKSRPASAAPAVAGGGQGGRPAVPQLALGKLDGAGERAGADSGKARGRVPSMPGRAQRADKAGGGGRASAPLTPPSTPPVGGVGSRGVGPEGAEEGGKKKLSLGAMCNVARDGGAMSPAEWMKSMQQRIGKVQTDLHDRRKSEPIAFQGLCREDKTWGESPPPAPGVEAGDEDKEQMRRFAVRDSMCNFEDVSEGIAESGCSASGSRRGGSNGARAARGPRANAGTKDGRQELSPRPGGNEWRRPARVQEKSTLGERPPEVGSRRTVNDAIGRGGARAGEQAVLEDRGDGCVKLERYYNTRSRAGVADEGKDGGHGDVRKASQEKSKVDGPGRGKVAHKVASLPAQSTAAKKEEGKRGAGAGAGARKDADKVKADDGAEKKEKEVGGAKRRVSGVAVGEELKMLAKVIDCCGLI